MPPGIGYAKDPFTDIQMQGQNGQSRGPSRLSPQQAVRVLSLRVPERAQANAPINPTLLNASGGAGVPGGLNQLLQSLMSLFAPSPQGPSGRVGVPPYQPPSEEPPMPFQPPPTTPPPPKVRPGGGGPGGAPGGMEEPPGGGFGDAPPLDMPMLTHRLPGRGPRLS